MAHGWQCDQCETWAEGEPFLVVRYDIELDGCANEWCDCDDDDDEQPFAEAHLCGYQCLAAWAMDEALKAPADASHDL